MTQELPFTTARRTARHQRTQSMAIATPEPIDAVPDIPLDDLPDTIITPPEALAPLPEPTLQQLRDDLGSLVRVVDAGLNRLPTVFSQHLNALIRELAVSKDSISAPEAGALQHLVDTLETLGARGMMVSTPYAAEIKARTPSSYAVTLTIERIDGKEFFAALAGMDAWLKQNGYTPQP